MEQKIKNLEPNPRKVLKKGTSVYIKVPIGNGQSGGTAVVINDAIVLKGKLDDYSLLGTVEDLVGKTINVITNVVDINSMTNKCVITTAFINEDGERLYYKIDEETAPQGGTVSFRGKYVITNQTLD